LLKKRFLFYPLVLFFALLVLDKIFLLPTFQKEFLQAGNSVFYHQRKVLLERLTLDPEINKRKLAIVFGDSRSYPFSEQGIPKAVRDNWSLYNFSGPQGIPMYSQQMLTEILARGITPEFVILSLSPEAFDDSKGFILSPFLRLACDPTCRKEVWDSLGWKEKYEFGLDQIFAIRSLEINLGLFFSRLKSKKLKEYKASYNPEFQLVNYAKGEYLMYATTANPVEKLERDTKRVSAIYMRSYTLGSSQMKALESFLATAKSKNIKTIVIWPKVYPKYYENYIKFDIANVWWKPVDAIAKQYGAFPINMNEADKCDLFNDASHQSVFCFVDQMKMIWDSYAP